MFTITDVLALLQILLIDVSLAGDNAIIVGMAAAGLAADKRHKAVLAGIAAATVLRIFFALFAVKLLSVVGLLAAGGLLLLWVSWKMYRDLRHMHKAGKEETETGAAKPPAKTLKDAIIQIIIADVSMSLDNVLAVAGVARDHMAMLVIGLVLSVALMGAASAWVAKIVARKPWIGYLGLAVVLYTSLRMIWDGGHELAAL